MQFIKMHGAGNDFVLLDYLYNPPPVDESGLPELARAMCDRHFGVGSDGLLLVVPSDVADARMRMFNPDGSESASCGNGIRCLGRYVRDRHGLGDPELRVETAAGVTTITSAPDGRVTVDMGSPIFAPTDIPVRASGADAFGLMVDLGDQKLPVSSVSMGNPHAVMFLEHGELESFPLEQIGPRVEHHELFPARVNFEICEIVAPDHMRVRVWERGAGITLACGTGACAATVVATRLGKLRPPARVDLPGGQLAIEWSEGGSVMMTGPTAYVFAGTWEANPDLRSLTTEEAILVR